MLPPRPEPIGPPENSPGKFRRSSLTLFFCTRGNHRILTPEESFNKGTRISPELDGMFFQPALIDGIEEGILWFRDPQQYPIYLREQVWMCCDNYFRIGHRKVLSWHIVAIAVHAPNKRGCHSVYRRRFWFVKPYDAFHGHSRFKSSDPDHPGWYSERYPAEAEATFHIQPNVPPELDNLDDTFDRSTLRWKGE